MYLKGNVGFLWVLMERQKECADILKPDGKKNEQCSGTNEGL